MTEPYFDPDLIRTSDEYIDGLEGVPAESITLEVQNSVMGSIARFVGPDDEKENN